MTTKAEKRFESNEQRANALIGQKHNGHEILSARLCSTDKGHEDEPDLLLLELNYIDENFRGNERIITGTREVLHVVSAIEAVKSQESGSKEYLKYQYPENELKAIDAVNTLKALNKVQTAPIFAVSTEHNIGELQEQKVQKVVFEILKKYPCRFNIEPWLDEDAEGNSVEKLSIDVELFWYDEESAKGLEELLSQLGTIYRTFRNTIGHL